MHDQRVAVVTGANRGLGRECVRQLADLGYTVVLTARTEEKAQAAASAMNRELGDERVVPFALDVTDESRAAALAAMIQSRFGRLDALVNNAGAIFDDPRRSTILDTTPDILKRTFENNTVGAFVVTRALAPLLVKSRGNVVNVSSGMGGLSQMGGGFPGYRLSKAALSALTRIFHAELGDAIHINAVCPGWVKTDLGGPNATRDVTTGASGIVWAATLDDDGPSGGFFRDGIEIPW
ncbi:MAG: SDR family NAD(P)-dependent oxidoreductase [Alphaproteobacteria bacterium]|nr:SDR family NAD(P)-dependent oxidoreductase [Alphaproteobacteria bacterium]